jgi:glycerol-3-phosphate dehydrogenase (NAD(P)+)
MSRETRVTVLGAGSWGSTVASVAARRAPTLIWARRPELADEINRRHTNSQYIQGETLHPSLQATASLEEAVEHADVLVVGVPSHGFRGVLEAAAPHLRPWVPIVSLTKGLEQGTRKRMTQVIGELLPGHPAGMLTGPNLAREVLAGYAAAAVIAMPDESVAVALQAIFRTSRFRVYTSRDVLGCELAAATKNVLAIAAGLADGLSTGDNTKAMVITRSLAELTRLGVAMGGDPRTFAGLAGMGDVIATCISPLSRNRFVGAELAKGRKLEDIVAGMKMVAEGVKTCSVVLELAEDHDVEMPIVSEVDAVLNHGRAPEDAYRGLQRIPPTSEHGIA